MPFRPWFFAASRRHAQPWRLVGSLLVGVLLLGVAPSIPVADAGGGSDDDPCGVGEGVTVVVDFASADGDRRVVRCAEGQQRNGFAALRHAGFAVTRVDVQPGAVCTIDAVPADDDDACWWDGYWAYFRSNGMKRWKYSSVGAGGVGPIAVDRAEGWRFTPIEEDPAPPRVRIASLPAYAAPRIGVGADSTHHSRYGTRPRLEVSVRSGPEVTGKVAAYAGARLLRERRLDDEHAVLRWGGKVLKPGRHRLRVVYRGSADVEPGKVSLVWRVRCCRA